MKKEIKQKLQSALMLMCIVFFLSCGGSNNRNSLAEGASGDMEAYESGEVNAIEQARPQIMVIPADQTLENFGALKETKIDGKGFVVRDYQKYLIKDDRFRRIASFIQDAFVNQNYPLADFEQTLKLLDTQASTDLADELQTDAKTQLLTTALPDIILEINYYRSSSLTSHNYKDRNVSYTLSAIDAYTTNVVATITSSNMKGGSTTELIQNDMQDKLPGLINDVQKYYSDILNPHCSWLCSYMLNDV